MKEWINNNWKWFVAPVVIGVSFGVSGGKVDFELNLDLIDANDSLVAVNERMIQEFEYEIAVRDSIIVMLAIKESDQRDTVMSQLEDRFDNADDAKVDSAPQS